MKIKIAIAYHKRSKIFSNEFFLPIHVGAARSKLNLEIQRDDVGDNISLLNCYCSELTATYWLWKNVTDSDFFGLVHYRRFFTFEKPNFLFHLKNIILFSLSKIASIFIVDARYSTSNVPFARIQSNELNEYLSKFSTEIKDYLNSSNTDCIHLKPIRSSNRSNRKSFSLAIGMFPLQKLEHIINEEFSEFAMFFNESLKSNSYYSCNMIIMKSEIFNNYCEFLFSVIKKYHTWSLSGLSANGINNVCLRSTGYIGEILTDTFIRKLHHENKKIKGLYAIELESPGSGKSSKQTTLIKRIKNVIKGDY